MSRRKPLPQALELEVATMDESFLGEAEHVTDTVRREVRLRNALPGEHVVARILKRRRGVWFGNAEQVTSSSSQRRRPPCDFFPRCGGCASQHLDGSQQLAAKERELAALLDAAGVEAASWRAAVAGPQFGYRRKARLGVRQVGERLFVGFRESFGNRVVDMSSCLTLDVRLSRLIQPLIEQLSQVSVRHAIPQVEVACGDDGVVLVIRHLEPLSARDQQLLADLERRTGAVIGVQPGGYDSVRDLRGDRCPPLRYAIADFGLTLEFEATSFTQVNVAMNAALVRHAAHALDGLRDIVDLFCGNGNFSLALARRGARVLGVEGSVESVARAQSNAELNQLTSLTRFEAADLYGKEAAHLALPDTATGWVMDPPRSGAGPHLARWLTPRLERIAYVSCQPATFAADARVLQDAGFDLTEVGIFDMFPQTAHVETLGVFHRR